MRYTGRDGVAAHRVAGIVLSSRCCEIYSCGRLIKDNNANNDAHVAVGNCLDALPSAPGVGPILRLALGTLPASTSGERIKVSVCAALA